MMFARLMEELTPENAPAALAMIRENVGGMESMRFMGMLAYKWGEVDPTSAMKELNKDGDRGGRFNQNFVLSGWAAKDPQAATKWLESYEGEDKGWLSMSLVSGLAKSDIDAAMKFASAIKDLQLGIRRLMDDRTQMLAAVSRAETKLREGTYGVCDACGSAIPAGRLEVRPWSTRCVSCS